MISEKIRCMFRNFELIFGPISIVFLFVSLNLPPLERYPNWDHIWGGGVTASNLLQLKLAVEDFSLPVYSPYIGFGWQQWGDTTEPSNPLSIIDLLIVLFPLELTLLIRTCIYAILGWLGAYLLVKDCPPYTPSLQILGAYLFVTPPFILAVTLHLSMTYEFYLIPLLLLFIKRALQENSLFSNLKLYAYSIFCYASGDVYGLVTFFGCTVAFAGCCLIFNSESKFNLKKLFCITFSSVLASAFYLVPFILNILVNSKNLIEISQHFNIPPLTLGNNLKEFFEILQTKGGLEIILNPHDKNVLFFYNPFCIYFLITILGACILINIKKYKIEKTTKMWFYGILATYFILIFGTVLYYSIPAITKTATGLFRLHLSWIFFSTPLFLIILLKIFYFQNRKSYKTFFISGLLILSSVLWDYFLLISNQNGVGTMFKNIYHWKRFSGEPQNFLTKIILNYDPYFILFFINLFLISLLFLYLLFDKYPYKFPKIAKVFAVPLIAFIFSLISINTHSALRYYGDDWAFQTKNSKMLDNFKVISQFLNKKISSDDKKNYRLILCGKEIYKGYEGRNINAVYPSELLLKDRFKIVGTYRNTINPYEALFLYQISGRWSNGNQFPPEAKDIEQNLESLKKIGCKYIVALDSELQDKKIKKIGDLKFDASGIFPDISDGCQLRLYEIINASSICTGLVKTNNKLEKNINIEIIKEKIHSLLLRTPEFDTYNLTIKYNFHPFWHAFMSEKTIPIRKNKYGFMELAISSPIKNLRLIYIPWDVYLGFFLSFIGFFFATRKKQVAK